MKKSDNNINFRFNKPEDSPGFLLWQISMLWQRKIKNELDKIGLTHTQFVLLAALGWISKSNKIVTQADIANQSKTDKMMVSKVLKTLEVKGFIERSNHQTDPRAKSIILTKNGSIIIQKALIVVHEVDDKYFNSISSPQKFSKHMQELLNNNS